jgi:hypothetical protein
VDVAATKLGEGAEAKWWRWWWNHPSEHDGLDGTKSDKAPKSCNTKRIICFTLPSMANIPSSDGRRLKRVSLPYRPIVMIGTCR